MSSSLARATFTRMRDGTAEEYAVIHEREAAYNHSLHVRVLDAVRALEAAKPDPGYAVDATVEFCEHYDENRFDPDYDWLPLEHFALAVQEVFSRQPAFR